jgi:hypothetical protein
MSALAEAEHGLPQEPGVKAQNVAETTALMMTLPAALTALTAAATEHP